LRAGALTVYEIQQRSNPPNLCWDVIVRLRKRLRRTCRRTRYREPGSFVSFQWLKWRRQIVALTSWIVVISRFHAMSVVTPSTTRMIRYTSWACTAARRSCAESTGSCLEGKSLVSKDLRADEGKRILDARVPKRVSTLQEWSAR